MIVITKFEPSGLTLLACFIKCIGDLLVITHGLAVDLGMTLRSGHVHIDKDWLNTIDQAAEAGQEYLIVASMPTNGQTVSNYQEVADTFS